MMVTIRDAAKEAKREVKKTAKLLEYVANQSAKNLSSSNKNCLAKVKEEYKKFAKLLVQGFILIKMSEISNPDIQIKKELYKTVSKFTEWWFVYRGRQDSIPEYYVEKIK